MIDHVYERGDIILYSFKATGSVQNGLRPAVIIQNTKQNASSPTTIIAPLTSELKKTQMFAHVVLGKRFGLRQSSQVLLEQLQTVNIADFGPYIGHIDDEEILHLIDLGLCKVLGIQSGSLDSSAKEVSA